jgi:hypothetical protein
MGPRTVGVVGWSTVGVGVRVQDSMAEGVVVVVVPFCGSATPRAAGRPRPWRLGLFVGIPRMKQAALRPRGSGLRRASV